MSARAAALLLGLLIPLPAFAQSLEVKDHGRTVKKLSRAELEREIPLATVAVTDPNDDDSSSREYVGFPIASFLQLAYGAGWKKGEAVLFNCLDGYQPAVDVADLATKPGFLVFRRKDERGFTAHHGKDGEVSLGPWYLVWDDLEDPSLAEGDWPWQVLSIDLIDLAARFPRLAPPSGSSEAARRGFGAFRHLCLKCHTLNGEGGTKAPELNVPFNVTEYWREPYLKRWIDQPSGVRAGATMPPLRPDLPERAATIDDLVAYLKAMSGRKVPPR